MSVALFIILGLVVGSFVNSLIWRFKDGKTMVAQTVGASKRSICGDCGHLLSAQDLIPVISWLTLGGRCRYCRAKIGWQHQVFELTMAAVFALSWMYWPQDLSAATSSITLVLWLIIMAGLVGLAAYDLKHLEIDNRIIYPLIGIAMGWRFAEALLFDGGAGAMREMTLGLLVGGGFFLALFYISRERWIGGGDVKLGFMMGVWLGPLYSAVAMLIAFYSAFIVIVPLMLLSRVKRRQPVPFGPFLILGFFIAGLWGAEVVEWYRGFALSN